MHHPNVCTKSKDAGTRDYTFKAGKRSASAMAQPSPSDLRRGRTAGGASAVTVMVSTACRESNKMNGGRRYNSCTSLGTLKY